MEERGVKLNVLAVLEGVYYLVFGFLFDFKMIFLREVVFCASCVRGVLTLVCSWVV